MDDTRVAGRGGSWTRRGMIRLTVATLVIAATLRSVVAMADEPSLAVVLQATGVERGLVVHVDAVDGSLAESLALTKPLLVFAVAPDPTKESRLRQRFVQAGIHGQATAGRLSAHADLPLADNVAAVVVADLDAAQQPKREELLRVLRPWGKAYVREGGRWRTLSKPRPTDVDDWPQYFHDAATQHLLQPMISPSLPSQAVTRRKLRVSCNAAGVGDNNTRERPTNVRGFRLVHRSSPP